jgi:hypothetical protein
MTTAILNILQKQHVDPEIRSQIETMIRLRLQRAVAEGVIPKPPRGDAGVYLPGLKTIMVRNSMPKAKLAGLMKIGEDSIAKHMVQKQRAAHGTVERYINVLGCTYEELAHG